MPHGLVFGLADYLRARMPLALDPEGLLVSNLDGWGDGFLGTKIRLAQSFLEYGISPVSLFLCRVSQYMWPHPCGNTSWVWEDRGKWFGLPDYHAAYHTVRNSALFLRWGKKLRLLLESMKQYQTTLLGSSEILEALVILKIAIFIYTMYLFFNSKYMRN